MRKLAVFYLIGLLAAVLLAALVNLLAQEPPIPPFFALPRNEHRWASLGLAILIGVVTVGLGAALEPLAAYAEMARWIRRAVDQLLERPLEKGDAFPIALYSAVSEEAFFRGFLQPFLGWLIAVKLLGKPDLAVSTGLAATAVVFGIVHFPVVRELIPWTFFALAVGVAFGLLAVWSGSLVPPVLAHFLINFLNLRRLADLPDPGPVPSDRAR